jgi:hypothetical protein
MKNILMLLGTKYSMRTDFDAPNAKISVIVTTNNQPCIFSKRSYNILVALYDDVDILYEAVRDCIKDIE